MEKYVSSLSSAKKNLLEAVQKGSLADVKRLLKRSPKFAQDEVFSYVLLVAGLQRENKSISLLLIRKKCKVQSSFKTDYYRTPLYYAVKQSDIKLFEELYKRGASLCDRDANIETPLELAIRDDDDSRFWKCIVSELDYENLDPNSREHIAIFHAACYKGNLEMMKKFAEKNFSVNSRSEFRRESWAGATPLQFLLKGCNYKLEVVKFLLQLDIDFNVQDERGHTPLLSTVDIHLEDDEYLYRIFRTYLRRYRRFHNPVNKYGLSHFHILCSLSWHRKGREQDETKLLKVLKHFIKNKVDINSANHYEKDYDYDFSHYAGFTALHWAAQSSPRVLELLLEHGADPKKVDAHERTPLHVLEFGNPGSVEMAELLLKYGADVDVSNCIGRTPLHRAFLSVRRNEPLVKLLWSKSKRTVNLIDSCGLSYLHIASSRDLKAVKTLVRKGASVESCIDDVGSKGFFRYTALHFAVSYNQVDIVQYLLSRGAAVNPPIECDLIDTPLYLACTQQLKYFYEDDDHPKPVVMDLMSQKREDECWMSSRIKQMLIIEKLLKHGSSISAKSFRGACPLLTVCNLWDSISYIARTYSIIYQNRVFREITIRREIMIHLLLSHGVNINSQENSTRWKEKSPLNILFEQSKYSPFERCIAENLLKKGANVDARNDGGYTSLHLAVIELAYTYYGETAPRKNPAFIDLFLQFGANVNSKSNDHDSILHSTVERYDPDKYRDEVFVKLTEHPDMDLDVQDQNGNTPLHLAVRNRKPFCVQNLLNAGADINVENAWRESPVGVIHNSLGTSGDRIKDQMNTNGYHVFKIVTNHLKKLVKLNYSVSEKNRQYLVLLSEIDSDSSVDVAIDEELAKLKSMKIDNYTSLYGILMKDPNDVANHVKNKVFQHMMALSSQLESDFPQFNRFLRSQYKRGLSRNLVLKPAKKALRIVTKVNWTDSCCEKILRHMCSDDLKNLTNSATVIKFRKKSRKHSADLVEPRVKIRRTK